MEDFGLIASNKVKTHYSPSERQGINGLRRVPDDPVAKTLSRLDAAYRRIEKSAPPAGGTGSTGGICAGPCPADSGAAAGGVRLVSGRGLGRYGLCTSSGFTPDRRKAAAATETLSIWDDPPAEAFAGYEPALLGDGTPLLPSQLGHLLCDSIIIRTVFTGPSTVLDTGRETRLYSESQKHAVIARDRGCTFPGCTDTYHTCDIHHAQEWSEGGKPTSRTRYASAGAITATSTPSAAVFTCTRKGYCSKMTPGRYWNAPLAKIAPKRAAYAHRPPTADPHQRRRRAPAGAGEALP